jgi:hypothetical protein
LCFLYLPLSLSLFLSISLFVPSFPSRIFFMFHSGKMARGDEEQMLAKFAAGLARWRQGKEAKVTRLLHVR